MKQQLLVAVEHALAGRWKEAHEIVQAFETDPTAAWIHGVLHKIEGDDWNSRYWYRKAGKLDCAGEDPNEALKQIRQLLISTPPE